MITDITQVNYFKNIAKQQFALMIMDDYGSDESLILFTDAISNIYKYLQYNSFEQVTIYVALDPTHHLKSICTNAVTVSSYENLTPLQGKSVVLEIKENGEVIVAVDYFLDIETARSSSIIYTFENSSETERIYGKEKVQKLTPIPGADSYFAIQTFKELEKSLEYYKTKVARHSECEILKNVWYDENKIFLKNGPEHRLRDSLTYHLKISLRNTEVRPEQVVDRSHPVDIKVTWALTNRLALIEIKWLGKSLFTRKKQFTKIYSEGRAVEGAGQLANYLDENIRQSPTYGTKGYLVIFDARRWNCNTDTLTINEINALKYLNSEIQYNPDFSTIRTDFSQPVRFFMEPKYLNNAS